MCASRESVVDAEDDVESHWAVRKQHRPGDGGAGVSLAGTMPVGGAGDGVAEPTGTG
jgi:hypothetical protein